SSVGRVWASCAVAGAATSEADAARATRRRLKLDELVLLLPARHPILAAAFDEDGVFPPRGGDGVDERALLFRGETAPAGRSQSFEGPITDLVLHPGRSLDPIAEVDVRQASLRRAPDVIENDIVPKPGPRLMLRVVEAVNHRQPIPLPICEAGTDQSTLPPVRRGFPIFDDKAGNRRVFHHVGVIYFVHGSHATAGMPAREVSLQQFELL